MFRLGLRRTCDRLLLGAAAGAAANVVKMAFGWLSLYSGWLSYSFTQIAASFFVGLGDLNSPAVLLLGVLTDTAVAMCFGVMLTYLITWTGGDRAVAKGAIFGTGFWLLVWGPFMGFNLVPAQVDTATGNIVALAAHVGLGMLTGALVVRFHDEIQP